MTSWPSDDPASPIVRYLTGEMSEREEIELLRELERDPARRELYDELRLMWERSELPAREWDHRTAIERIKQRRPAAAPARIPARAPMPVLPRRVVPMAMRIAAGIVVIAGSAALWRIVVTPPAPTAASVAFREFSTPRGQRATFQLSDGTRLILAADSKVRVPVDYGRTLREVHLDGEAFFEVVHDATRPFRVRAKHAVAEDLGTRFDVRAYPEDSAVAVSVAEGAVALGRAETPAADRRPSEVPQGVVLKPGEVGTLALDGRVTTATGAAAASYLAWTEGRLRFFRTPLADAVRTIGRWHDLDVRVEGDALAALPITAEFGVQSVEELLRELAVAADAKLVWSGKIVTLHSKS